MMTEKDKGCPNCGSQTDIYHTNRYLESGEAVCDCKNCGKRLCTSADWKK